MLEIEDLTVEFSGVRPLDGVSARFADEICGVIGPNGAGKTTLLNVVSGFVRPTSGGVSFNGQDLKGIRPHRRARMGIRRTFQRNQAIDALTVEENLRIGIEHVPREQSVDAGSMLDLLGLTDVARTPVAALSGFERRLVELGRAAGGNPQLLLLDEPGAGLNEPETKRLGEILRALAQRLDARIVVVDHDMSLVRSVCASVAVLDFGRLLATGPTGAVLDDPVVQRAYLGTEDVQ